MVRRIALVAGVTGQDSAFIAELLPGKGYMVQGFKRRASSFNTGRVDPHHQDRKANDLRFIMLHGDLTDATERVDADLDVISRETRHAVKSAPWRIPSSREVRPA